ncbi:hypothetical protein GCM10010193_69970 [Kitasatospora atroaurantiaca]|uniref:Uncharacterized protein n=1 Tax=Kitasatospora atroaurantiaca TaxID=285545 RepID=A0A561ENC5_9ACTN|nr:hypothetical protein [Kitasatospora atroaurantiaca]TWE17082.1 hypothetical protein FB465_2087 [Kitasatospora atroaurantiaca]
MEVTYQAAWVPDDDPHRPWEEALALAAEWVADRCEAENALAVLVTNAFNSPSYPAVLARLGGYDHVTPRSSAQIAGERPTLAFVPVPKAMDLAVHLARNSSLAVVESRNLYPLSAWARGVGAINLLDPDGAIAPLDARLAEAVEDLHMCGNNGYVDNYGKRDAKRILAGLKQQGILDIDEIVGAVSARGIRHEAAARLRELAAKA